MVSLVDYFSKWPALFSIAYAQLCSCAASHDDILKLKLDQEQYQNHLTSCFKQQLLIPVSVTTMHTKVSMSRKKHFFVHLFCACSMPEGYDSFM